MSKFNGFCVGMDIGSTTAKIVLMRGDRVIFEKYERHFSKVREKVIELAEQIRSLVGSETFSVAISGSAGMGLAKASGIPFIQEVFATEKAVRSLTPEANVVIELGGEDAKIIFLDGVLDERMNGACAGGTGAFIDQMAVLLNMSADEMDEMSLKSTKTYPIASRCGVFAKTDIQALINQGAKLPDVAASIYQAVVSQTIVGLAQGRKIGGNVIFLGGPLYYCKGLQQSFKKGLQLSDENAIFPEYARYSVSHGAALYAKSQGWQGNINDFLSKLRSAQAADGLSHRLQPLFSDSAEYECFCERHSASSVPHADIDEYCGNAYLGIDCGSTTTKLVLISEDKDILYSFYGSNKGNPLEIVCGQLKEIYQKCSDRICIAGSAVTGYGEDLIKNAFNVDFGVVETIAHYTAARHFKPNVGFILDIGGQDIKCFKIKNNTIDSILLNEACSSGCGSFIETFAKSMGYSIEDFARLGLFAKQPVDLGSRCTVFMNSSVKQSQREGATVEDISAGLSISVVKNAIYKVIRAGSAEDLDPNIVVQGGTFYNDAVLRALELELGQNVVRPAIAGLMGAYGAALYAMRTENSTLISEEDLSHFAHQSKSLTCKGCTNHCHLTVNTFSGKKQFVSGNQCERMTGLHSDYKELPNLYGYKQKLLTSLRGTRKRPETIGLPLALGMYELLPFWYAFFDALGFGVEVSGLSDKSTYEKGHFSIPSDTVCYPAKIMHGHIEELLSRGVDAVFYPGLTYNMDERDSDNCYNCPVVAYYGETLVGNMDSLKNIPLLHPYVNINNEKELERELYAYFSCRFSGIRRRQVHLAVQEAFRSYRIYMDSVRQKGREALEYAKKEHRRVMILAGRPYHCDPEINHGIDKLANLLGFVVVSEDSVCDQTVNDPLNVLNQWTYHSRLYRAAKFAAENPDVELVQLVSFGCGVDAITTDEVRRILESAGKFYTQLKIDEITNLGAVKIRLRSLIGALNESSELQKKQDTAVKLHPEYISVH